MLKKTLLAIAVVALMAMPAMAVFTGGPPTPGPIIDPGQPYIPPTYGPDVPASQVMGTVDVTMVIDKYATVDFESEIELTELSPTWMGSGDVTVTTNFNVILKAEISAVAPAVGTFYCNIPGCGDGWAAMVDIDVNANVAPQSLVLRAKVDNPDFSQRLANPTAQSVAQIVLTLIDNS